MANSRPPPRLSPDIFQNRNRELQPAARPPFHAHVPTEDQIHSVFGVSDLLGFTTLLGEALEPTPKYHWRLSSGWALLSGRLNLSHDDISTRRAAHFRLRISADWKSDPPAACCTEPWIRREKDWHSGEDGWLCYVLKDEWRDTIAEVELTSGDSEARIFAIQYAINNLRSLTYRHYISHILGITVWPREWLQWSHEERGTKEYKQFKLKGGQGVKSRRKPGT